MKRIGKLFDLFGSYENLYAAWRKAYRGSKRNLESLRFFHRLETELMQLRDELISGDWRPAPYRYFDIYDPKHRTISVASFRDRVVHHAVVNIIEPIYERRFIFDSYATRPAKGAHAAVARAQFFVRKNVWYLKSDIEKYFDSINHDYLLSLLHRTIKDKQLITVLEKIISNGGIDGRGLPIGNLTSQFLANVYLHPFDMFMKQELGCKHYIRYMDDFVVFGNDKSHLKEVKKAAAFFLQNQLGLQLKPSATFFNNRTNGLSFLGKRIFPAAIRLHNHNGRRITRRLNYKEKQWNLGVITDEEFMSSVNSYWALLTWYPLSGLRKKYIGGSVDVEN
jgi:retron-type reverse transcriptase